MFVGEDFKNVSGWRGTSGGLKYTLPKPGEWQTKYYGECQQNEYKERRK